MGLLAVDSAGTLAVFDASRPQDPPKTLLTMPAPTNITVSWSRDGQWIACKTKTYSQPRHAGIAIAESLWAIPAAGGRPKLIQGGVEVWPFLWGSDGFLYGWVGTRTFRFAPPTSLASENPDATARTPSLALLPRQEIVRITAGDPPEVVPLPQLGRVLQRGRFPDGRRFLMTRLEPGQGPRNVVVDATGRILAGLDGSAREDSSGTPLGYFTATSVTADGQYVAGFYEVDTKAGEDIAKAVVFLTDATGRSRLPVDGAPYSTRIECSPTGHWVAAEMLRGGVEVGTLEVPR
jgi:hypothetical protein